MAFTVTCASRTQGIANSNNEDAEPAVAFCRESRIAVESRKEIQVKKVAEA